MFEGSLAALHNDNHCIYLVTRVFHTALYGDSLQLFWYEHLLIFR